MNLSSYDSFYVRAGMRYNLTAKTCEGLYCRKLVANESEIVIVTTFAIQKGKNSATVILPTQSFLKNQLF